MLKWLGVMADLIVEDGETEAAVALHQLYFLGF